MPKLCDISLRIQIARVIKVSVMKSYQKKIIKASLTKIITRTLPQGGFSTYNGGHFRPDATAWAVLALEAG